MLCGFCVTWQVLTSYKLHEKKRNIYFLLLYILYQSLSVTCVYVTRAPFGKYCKSISAVKAAAKNFYTFTFIFFGSSKTGEADEVRGYHTKRNSARMPRTDIWINCHLLTSLIQQELMVHWCRNSVTISFSVNWALLCSLTCNSLRSDLENYTSYRVINHRPSFYKPGHRYVVWLLKFASLSSHFSHSCSAHIF